MALIEDMAFCDRGFGGEDRVRHALAVDPRLIGAERGRIEARGDDRFRSEEHTSELQSLMRISYAVFCLKKKKQITQIHTQHMTTSKERHDQRSTTSKKA